MRLLSVFAAALLSAGLVMSATAQESAQVRATLMWDEPDPESGGPVAQYTVQCAGPGGYTWFDEIDASAPLEARLTVEPGDEPYSCEIRAIGPGGDASDAEVATFVPRIRFEYDPPAPPRQFRITLECVDESGSEAPYCVVVNDDDG